MQRLTASAFWYRQTDNLFIAYKEAQFTNQAVQLLVDNPFILSPEVVKGYGLQAILWYNYLIKRNARVLEHRANETKG